MSLKQTGRLSVVDRPDITQAALLRTLRFGWPELRLSTILLSLFKALWVLSPGLLSLWLSSFWMLSFRLPGFRLSCPAETVYHNSSPQETHMRELGR